MRGLNLKVTIEIDGSPNVGCKIERDGETTQWEELNTTEQTRVINSLASFCQLFYKNYKHDEL